MLLIHALDEAVWPHISPVLVYELEASCTAVPIMNYGPTFGHFFEAWPKRMLSLVIDQNVVGGIFIFERVGHVVLLDWLRFRSNESVKIRYHCPQSGARTERSPFCDGGAFQAAKAVFLWLFRDSSATYALKTATLRVSTL